MRILLATSAAVPSGGGIASYNQELLKAFSSDNSLNLLTDSQEYNVVGFKTTQSTFGYSVSSFEYVKNLVEQINASKYDIIINSNSAFIPVMSPFLNAPIVSVSHFVNGMLADNAGYNNKYLNAIISLSEYGKEYLLSKFKIADTEKVKVIYNFVHPKYSVIDKTSNPILTIVYPGGTSIKKSFDVVMQTAMMLKRTNLNFRFIWLGGTKLPSARFSLFKISDIKQILFGDDRFEIKGVVQREDAELIISSANVFLLPSLGEGCPMTLLEAMRSGCIPVISDAKHGSLDLINMSGAGIIVPQGNYKELYNQLVDIINNHERYSYLYDKTIKFSTTKLTSTEWKKQMNEVITKSVSIPKIIEPLSKDTFSHSLKPYLKLIKRNRINSIIKSASNRIKMDWIHFKWNILNR